MPTPACPERDANDIVAFPVTRGSKLKKVCTTRFTRTRPRQPNWPHSKTPHHWVLDEMIEALHIPEKFPKFTVG